MGRREGGRKEGRGFGCFQGRERGKSGREGNVNLDLPCKFWQVPVCTAVID